MVTIRPTKMLARQLGITLPKLPPPVPDRIADWCAHSFATGDQNWLVFCNTTSLYAVFAKADGVTDGESLARRLGGMVLQVITANGFSTQARAFKAALTEYQWAPIPDRSVLGSINELIYLADPLFDDPHLTPGSLAERVSNAPMSAIGMNSPKKVFARMGTQLP